MFRIEDLCQRFGVTPHTVLAWIHGGELKALNVGREPGTRKPRWRISEVALHAFEQLRTAARPLPRSSRRKRPADVVKFYP
jgi:excisionase family DNA binding protein